MCMATMHPAGGLTTGTVFGRRKKNMKWHDTSSNGLQPCLDPPNQNDTMAKATYCTNR